MDHKSGKWAKQILSLQHPDGSWGCFHTLSHPTKENPMTTEQALRRLKVLGFTKDDAPIRRAVRYMEANLNNPEPTVFIEKKHDSKTYGDTMLAAWLHIFDSDNQASLDIARKWTEIIGSAFETAQYNHDRYSAAYEAVIGKKLNPKAGCLANFVVFYQIALTSGCFDKRTEAAVFDYIIKYPSGIGYIYDRPIAELPEAFMSRQTVRYLAAIELLAGFGGNRDKLSFIVDWLNKNKDENGQWDLGSKAKDGIYFPLSDSWRTDECRKADCTERIQKLLNTICG